MNTKVLIAMSGGVDSSVTAALLKEQGCDVTGAFIKVWYPEWLPCSWREDRRDAMRVCTELGIPFRTIDASEAYKRNVVDYMITEYKAGRTPNPDVMCNKMIKFGVFLKQGIQTSTDYIATGHHARIREQEVNNGRPTYQLLTGKDKNKDQSYFLWTVTQAVLKQTFFPVGEYEKSEIRSLAKKFSLHNADKKDSQGLCFIGHVEMSEFLKHYIKTDQGDVLNENGVCIGMHDGAVLYTIGQRHGFTVTTKTPTSGPWYVVKKDVSENTITVSESYKEFEDLGVREIVLQNTNWISGEAPSSDKKCWAQIRYRQPLQSCTVKETQTTKIKIMFDESQHGVASGQSCVLYDGEICLGGGVIY